MPAGAAAGTTVYVVPADLSSYERQRNLDMSGMRRERRDRDGRAGAGTKWILDTEIKPDRRRGRSQPTASSSRSTPSPNVRPAPDHAAAEKVRFQYYVGSGGYPTIDSQHPTLNTLLASPISWDLKLHPRDRTDLRTGLPGAAAEAAP